MIAFEALGGFFVPETPDDIIAGVLRFSKEEGLRLELVGCFGGLEQAHKRQPREVICGMLKSCVHGNLITLVRASQTNLNIQVPGFTSEAYWCEFAFFGQHYSTLSDIHFDRIRLEFTYLDNWASATGISGSLLDVGEGSEKRREVSISYAWPSFFKAEVEDGTIQLASQISFDQGRHAYIKESLHFDCKCPLKRRFDELLSHFAVPLQNFLTFGTDHPNAVKSVLFNSDDLLREFDGRKIPTDVKCIYSATYSSTAEKKHLIPHTMLFCEADLGEDAARVLSAWFALNKTIGVSFDLLFGGIYRDSEYLESQFLSVFQAVEAYHRAKYPGTHSYPESHAKSIKEIVDLVPEDRRKWLSEKLKYSNEVSARERLSELHNRCEQILSKIFEPRAKKRIRSLVAARNLLVHRDMKSRTAVSGQKLHNYTELLRYLLKSLILLDLGLSMEKVESLLERNQKYIYFIGLVHDRQSSGIEFIDAKGGDAEEVP